MPQVKVYNLDGVETGTIELDDKIFTTVAKPEMLYQVVRVMQARQRTIIAHTKDRSEVRGGGRKPWKQKGTGRARHGSTRSPIWRHGGITFGPTIERNFTLHLPRKMAQKALRAVLSDKVATGHFLVAADLALPKPASKQIAAFLKKLKVSSKKVLFLSEANLENAVLSARNLPNVTPRRLENINVLDLLSHDNVLISQATIAKLTAQLS